MQRALRLLGDSQDAPVIALSKDRMILLKPEEICMVRVEGGQRAL
jgi:hypothetical protein